MKKTIKNVRVCSRCESEHHGPFDTCNDCRAYNNANKLVYAMAKQWDLSPEEVRDGLKRALANQGRISVFKDED